VNVNGRVQTEPLRLQDSGERQMRFIVCARAREDGTVSLVAPRSFPNRREAVEAIIASNDVDALLDSDVFLVDLESATPVALIPFGGSGAPAVRLAGEPSEASEALEQAGLWEGGEAEVPSTVGSEGEKHEDAGEGDAARFGSVEIDIEAWTCEDCIYVLTCEKSGTLRPARCGSFQWRA
jgi:hypothetical protein